ncbi:MAG TPA: class I SAM-dependent methyltransferase [Candidatus Acidoferrales bacterium]|nr:class I SAM-dependent methyltransferase [Candidatus Acidoferrales bacterium]
MSQDTKQRVCPVENAGTLDNKIRKFLQNPRKILKPYVRSGMTVLDVGCGPGVFSIEMAEMVGPSGNVVAADLQEGMLQLLKEKIKGTPLEKIVEPYKCEASRIGLTRKVDFVLAFYMVHEVPDKRSFFKEIRTILRDNEAMLIVEPNFHVSKKAFGEMLDSLVDLRFEVIERPRFFFSRSVLVKNVN